jgi:hypothetical protein
VSALLKTRNRLAVNSGSESWTGIGVVADFGAVVLMVQWPHGMRNDVNWRSELLQRLQEVRSNCKTCNQSGEKMGRHRTEPARRVQETGRDNVLYFSALRLANRSIACGPDTHLTAPEQPHDTSTILGQGSRRGADNL